MKISDPPEDLLVFPQPSRSDPLANVRSCLSTTRKNDVGGLNALTSLFNDDPWMPPQAA